MRDGNLFEALNEFGEERIGNVFNDDAQKTAAARDKGAGMRVGKVIQVLDSLPDALGEALADYGSAVDSSGDRGDGNLGRAPCTEFIRPVYCTRSRSRSEGVFRVGQAEKRVA